MKDLTKARKGLKRCWESINGLSDEFIKGNPKIWRTLKVSMKDVEYGYEDCIKKLKA